VKSTNKLISENKYFSKMSFKILLILALSVYMVSAEGSIDKGPTHEIPPVDKKRNRLVTDYDCSNKDDGNYIHPNDCTKFMSCVGHQIAYEMDCAICHTDPNTCPTGRLHYHHPSNKCEFANIAGCVTAGLDCDPDDCQVDGWCHEYTWCEREESDHKGTGKRGFKKSDNCPEEFNLYFNPKKNDIHGGVCDFWENLDDDTKDAYNKDPDCIDPHCEWKPDPDNECSSKYWYFHPEKNEGNDIPLECPSRLDGEQLLWDQDRKSCHACTSVKKSDGTACC